MSTATRRALEELLRSHRLHEGAPPLRGVDRRGVPLVTGIGALDGLSEGGLPRGAVSEIHGPASSGRTGIALAAAARTTRDGALVAWVDPLDRLDPDAASAAGSDLTRLLWIRGRGEPRESLAESLSALGVLLGSGLFDLVVFDVADVPAATIARLPAGTWMRLAGMLRDTRTAVLMVAGEHVPHAARGVAIGLTPGRSRWSGRPGPGRLFQGLDGRARLWGAARPADVAVSLQAMH